MSLLILAMDQRPWLTKALYGHTGTAAVTERAAIADGKHMVLDGLLAALAAAPELREHAAVLVDDLLGPGVPERAHAHRVALSMPLERGGLDVYETEPADLPGFLRHHTPTLPKVLIRYNVDGDREGNAVQRDRLAEVATAVRDAGGRFLVELLVPPTPGQLAAVDGDTAAFDRKLRPELILRGMTELSQAFPVDVWKLEHLAEVGHYRAAADLAAATGGECILLGANAPVETVDGWLREAAAGGFTGFAIGRSIWWDALRGLLSGAVARPDAVAAVAATYHRFATGFLAAASTAAAGTGSAGTSTE
ncbi:2-deoxy-5-keto-D-gluconate 6-phosphate aldolase domain-containing protein [Micromonospora sp. NPDC049900]|uniref:2-deoxy-5-keto-D-gluconate 6-phosphate aldolase domain-containing protein n=1 Tax=Micromonospora sp. NPDC049900 TaxID=3364275 RepID=UPI0037A50D49